MSVVPYLLGGGPSLAAQVGSVVEPLGVPPGKRQPTPEACEPNGGALTNTRTRAWKHNKKYSTVLSSQSTQTRAWKHNKKYSTVLSSQSTRPCSWNHNKK